MRKSIVNNLFPFVFTQRSGDTPTLTNSDRHRRQQQNNTNNPNNKNNTNNINNNSNNSNNALVQQTKDTNYMKVVQLGA